MQKEYYSITNKLYSLKDADHFDYAIMSAVATFNYPFVTDSEDEKVTEIKVQPFTITDIASRLKLSNIKNVKVNNEKIEQSLKKLMKAKVLKVVEVLRSEDKENTFILKQNVDTEGQFTGFASIIVDEFFNITLKIKKDSDRIKALACYVSIVQRIFKTAKRTKQANFNWENTLTYFVNWESQENIGNKYGMSRKAVAKSIELLCDVEAIALRVIKQKNGGKEVKNIYSKFSDADHLDDYVELMIDKGEYTKQVVKVAYVDEIHAKQHYFDDYPSLQGEYVYDDTQLTSVKNKAFAIDVVEDNLTRSQATFVKSVLSLGVESTKHNLELNAKSFNNRLNRTIKAIENKQSKYEITSERETKINSKLDLINRIVSVIENEHTNDVMIYKVLAELWDSKISYLYSKAFNVIDKEIALQLFKENDGKKYAYQLVNAVYDEKEKLEMKLVA